jgi:hypothetical protein
MAYRSRQNCKGLREQKLAAAVELPANLMHRYLALILKEDLTKHRALLKELMHAAYQNRAT